MNTPAAPPPDVSLVVPVRNEAGNIGPLIGEIASVLDRAGLAWELFVVDDGSTDGSWDEITAAAAHDPSVIGIRQPRGLGKSAALMEGFRRCRGPRIVMLDGDGQDDPAGIPAMLAALADPASGRDGADVVNGWKRRRLDPWHKTLPSRVFNLLVGWVSGLWLHDHNCGIKAFRAEAARSLALEADMHRFITVLAAAAGFRVVEQAVHHRPRTIGQSKYGFKRFFTGLVDLARISRRLRTPGTVAPADAARDRLRRQVYWILGAVAVGGLLGRIGAVSSVDRLALEKRLVSDAVAKARETAGEGETVDEEAIRASVERSRRLMRPFLSANDRSRWSAVRALVERGTFAIDEIVVEPGWDTIDAVAHADGSGRIRLYSSKPPLLSLVCAGPYWILHRLTGWTLGDHPFEMGRMLLVVCSLLPFALMLAGSFRLIDAVGASDWGRIWGAALISSGTFLTTFAVSLTNHLPAAACAVWSGWLLVRIVGAEATPPAAFVLAGALAAATAAFELPALAWCVALLGLLLLVEPRRTITLSLPAALLIGVAALGANWLAHGSVVPPYGHRATVVADGAVRPPPERGTSSANPDNWYDYSVSLPGGKQLTSYWRDPRGVDRGEASATTYAWHALIGHHGILALTPAWWLVPCGLWVLLGPHRRRDAAGRAPLALAVGGVSVVVLLFYLARPQIDRNYGGVTSGFRWVFWMAPLWAAVAVPAADALSRSRAGRILGLTLLGLSVLSVAFPTWNPWSPPWIEQWMRHSGWLPPA